MIDISITLTTNQPAGNSSPRNSIEVRVNGQAVVRTYEHEAVFDACQEAIRDLIEYYERESDE